MRMPRLRCKRCGYRWIPRTPKKPERCPNCNSPYWDKEYSRKDYIVKKKEINHEKRRNE